MKTPCFIAMRFPAFCNNPPTLGSTIIIFCIGILSPLCSPVFAGDLAGQFSKLFIESKGQVKDETRNPVDNVLFYSQGERMQLFITTKGYSIVTTSSESGKTVFNKIDFALKNASLQKEQVAFVKGSFPVLHYYHAGSVLEDVRSSNTVIIRNIYPGIDWVWSFDENKNPKHEFMVNIGADASVIRYSVSGAEAKLSDGNNIIYSNENLTVQEGPVLFQYLDKDFPGDISVRDNQISFNIPLQLSGGGFTIDPPLQLLWGAVLDGQLQTSFKYITPDDSFNTITVGYSSDYAIPTFPQTAGSYSVYPAQETDLIIMKTDPDQNLIWATFFGGSENEEANAVTATPIGIFITGYSESWDFPQASHGINHTNYVEPVQLFGRDAFVLKFDNLGKWRWSTGYGGSKPDEGLDIKYHNGKVYVAGYTESGNFPVFQKPGAYFYRNSALILSDAFLLEFDTAGNRTWATCFGGSREDYFTSLFVDGTGIYTTGYSDSTGTSIPFQSSGSAYFQNSFQKAESILTRFSPAGVLNWSTYFGGAGNDYASSIIKNDCGIFICGSTDSAGLPVQSQLNGNYYQSNYAGGDRDGFIAKFTPDSLQKRYCTYYGTTSDDALTRIATDSSCNTIATGFTNGAINLVGSPNYFFIQNKKAGYDGIMLGMDAGQVPFWATYFGSDQNDFGYSLWFPHPYLVDMVGEGFHNYGKDTIGGTYVNPVCTNIGNCPHATCNGVSNRFLQIDSTGGNPPGHPIPGGGGGGGGGCGGRRLQFHALIPLQNSCPNQCNGRAIMDTSNVGGCAPFQFIWSSGGSAIADSNLCEFYWSKVRDSNGRQRVIYGRFDIFRVLFSDSAVTYCSSAEPDWDSIIHMAGGGPPYTIILRGVSASCPGTAFFDLVDTANCIISYSMPWTRYNLNIEINLEITEDCYLFADEIFPPGICPQIPGNATMVLYDGIDTFIVPYAELNDEDELTFLVTPGRYYSGYLDLPDCPVAVNGVYNLDSVQYSISKTIACQASDGSISITVHGDTAAFSNSVSSYTVYFAVEGDSLPTSRFDSLVFTNFSSQTLHFNNLPADEYDIEISSSISCDTVNVIEDLRTFNVRLNSPKTHCGISDTLTATVAGGYAPFSYQWSPPAADTASIIVLNPGIYSLTVTDSTGCSSDQSIIVPGSSPLQIDSLFENTTPCVQGLFSTATVFASGGTSPRFYVWSSGESSANANFLAQGANWVRVFDLNGCVDIDSFQNTKQLPMLVGDSSTDASCYGLQDGVITLSVAFGYPNFSVDWSNGGSGLSLQNLAAGEYKFTVTDNQGCVYNDSITINEPDSIQYFQFTFPATCGAHDGFADVNVGGGSGNYSILWQDSNANFTRNDLNAGVHGFIITDINGCEQSGSVTVGQFNPPFDGSIAFTDVKCFGGTDGTATVTMNNPNNPIIYSWDNGETTSTADSLTAGFHLVEITDSLGCEYSDSVFIDEPAPLFIYDIQTGDAACSDTNGYVFIGVSGGTQNYQVLWDDGGTGLSRNNISPGFHSFTITDANGCQLDSSVTISQTNPVIVDLTVINISCFGETDGSASATVTNALSPFTYNWSTGSSDPAISDLSAGDYSLTVTDNRNCVSIDSFEIIEPAPFVANVDTGNGIQCFNELISVFIYGSGGTLPYNNINVMRGAGTYTEMITDARGCTDSVTFTLSEPDIFTANITVIQPTCISDESATITASGGVSPYHAWNGTIDLGSFSSSLTVTAAQLSGGNNFFQVFDSLGCVVNLSAFVNSSGIPAGDVYLTNPLCNGDSNGSITISMYRGVSPFTIQGISFVSSITFSNLPAGVYTYVVTDSLGCTATIVDTLKEPPLLTASYSQLEDFNCHGDSIQIAFQASGGTPPYLGDDTLMFSEGNFTHIITDSSGCIASVSFSLTQPDSLIGNVSVVQPGCDTSGSVTISASGGTSPYHVWYDTIDLGIFTSTITVAPIIGNNSIQIFDSLGCVVNLSALVNNVTQPVGFAVSSNLLCNGDSVSAQIIMIQGASPFTTQNLSFDDTLVLQNLSAGNYSYVVTDAVGCEDTISFSIHGPAPLLANYNILQDFICYDDSVLVVFYGAGGTPPYSGDGTQWFSGGTSVHAITDANGCTTDTSLTLVAPLPFTVDTFITSPDCNNTMGSVILVATGGMGPYTVYVGKDLVTFFDTTTLTLSSGSYTYTISDSLGCSQNISFTLAPVTVVEGIIQSQPAGCNGDSSGSITIVMQQGAPPYTVNGISFTDSITFNNLPSGNYQYTIADTNNCMTVLSATITESETLAIDSLNLLSGITCYGMNDAVVQVITSGGTPAYTYFLIRPEGDTLSQLGNIFTNLSPGSYTVVVVDANGCVALSTITIDDFIPSNHRLEQDSISCYGENDGAIKIYSEPAERNPFTYSLNGGTPQLYNVFYDLGAGDYQIIVADKNNCPDTLYATLTQPDSIDGRVWLNGELLPLDSLNMDEREFADFTKLNTHPWEIEFSPDIPILVHSDSLIRIEPDENISFTVRVYLDSLHLDCFVEYTGLIAVQDVPPLPNIITPNGDGFNDLWEVDLEEFPNPDIIIFDRWGAIIYESDNYSNNWDGSYDGEYIADGTYFYLMTVAAHGGKIYKGNINVLNSSR